MGSIAVRYAPINSAHLPSFPNLIPNIHWQTYLPRFKDKRGDDSSLHLARFHKHIYNLGIELHEDSLMKIFMVSLEGNARSWYEVLPTESIYSLRDFHLVFHEHFKDKYPSLLLIQDYFTHDKGFIENLKDQWGDDWYMDEDILEILHEYSPKK